MYAHLKCIDEALLGDRMETFRAAAMVTEPYVVTGGGSYVWMDSYKPHWMVLTIGNM